MVNLRQVIRNQMDNDKKVVVKIQIKFLLVAKSRPHDVLLTVTVNTHSASFQTAIIIVNDVSSISNHQAFLPKLQFYEVLLRNVEDLKSVGCIKVPTLILE